MLTDKLLERLNRRLAMALPKDGNDTAESQSAWNKLRDLILNEKICGTDIKFSAYEEDPSEKIPDPPPFTPPPPPDAGDAEATQRYCADYLAATQRQCAQENLRCAEEQARRVEMTDRMIAARWQKFREEIGTTRSAQTGSKPKPIMSAEEVLRDMALKRRKPQ